MSVPNVILSNGIEIPQLGFGVWRVPADDTQRAVAAALDAGYRHIDTATLYDNEEGVGAAIRESGRERDEVFVTTKVWNSDQGYDDTMRAFDASMERLGLDVLDLYLIHWPLPGKGLAADTWRAMEKLYLDGRIRAIGVSNFHPHHLKALIEHAEVVPTVNQVELHPYLQQDDVRAANNEHGVATEAWSPLAKGGDLLRDPVVQRLAEKHGRTPAQVVLRWHIHTNTIVIPKSVTPARIKENIDIFEFELDAEDMAAINGLDRGHRIGAHPEEMS
ncbi:MAG: aldo/keto reductase [Nocardioides sp.]